MDKIDSQSFLMGVWYVQRGFYSVCSFSHTEQTYVDRWKYVFSLCSSSFDQKSNGEKRMDIGKILSIQSIAKDRSE